MKSPFIDGSGISIFFGDASHCPDNFNDVEYIAASSLHSDKDQRTLARYCEQFAQDHNLSNVVVLQQVHGVDSLIVSENTLQKKITVREQDGDFLITNQPSIGLGVLTADCLPVVAYDKAHHAVGIAHAGWKGSVAGILPKMIQAMSENYGTVPSEVALWFGPAARPCCYEVQHDFVAATSDLSFQDQFLIQKNNKFFFDGTVCNTKLLIPIGVVPASIDTSYNVCTICTPGYYSHRRKNTARQVSFVWIP